MKASEELTDKQSRQVYDYLFKLFNICLTLHTWLAFDVEHAYAEFFRSLGGDKDSVS